MLSRSNSKAADSHMKAIHSQADNCDLLPLRLGFRPVRNSSHLLDFEKVLYEPLSYRESTR